LTSISHLAILPTGTYAVKFRTVVIDLKLIQIVRHFDNALIDRFLTAVFGHGENQPCDIGLWDAVGFNDFEPLSWV
jgi:hypothetical protein